MLRLSFLLVIALLLSSCQSNNETYVTTIEKWKEKRIKELTAARSWSSLCALGWLEEGQNIMGSARRAKVRLPKDAPDTLASIYKNKDLVRLVRHGENEIRNDSLLIDTLNLITDKEQGTHLLKSGDYFFTAIDRNGEIGIRVWDTLHEGRTKYKELPSYPISESWNIKAKFIPFDTVRTIYLKNVLGMNIEHKIEGLLEFEFEGETYAFEPLDGGEDGFFIIFADETTGGETYGGGRYLYCDLPDSNNETYIDFNKAHTPPCGFTAFATCLLPSKQNTLPFKLLAGERFEAHH